MLAGKVFYIAIAAGIVFIAIGIASSVYSNVPVDVPLDNTIRPGTVDVITPDMNVGSTASISVSGTIFHIEIKDPDGQVIESRSGNSTFIYDQTAQKAGQHTITINNTGTSDLTIVGHAQTKSSPLGLIGALMLVVTGIITIGIGLRFRRH
jgi:hypothetical protein